MDLSLGGPVDVPGQLSAYHGGYCNDSEFGCIKCHNENPDTLGTCQWCPKENVKTLIVKAWDEPVLYELCLDCVKNNKPDDQSPYEYDDEIWDDDEDNLGLQYPQD